VSWQGVRGHDRIVESLANRLRLGRFPHALLFVGPEGIGKRSLARKLAQGLLCETRAPLSLEPCGTCPGCLQVEGGTHPDFVEAGRPEDRHELTIAVVRELCNQFAFKPARGTHKVAILDDADLLNEEASNAFLKTLEEPPPGAVLILIGSSPELQLETIVSRCQVVQFDPLPDEEIATLLLEQKVVNDAADAARLATLSEGSVSRARGLADPELERFRRVLIDEIAATNGFEAPDLGNRLLAQIRLAGKESIDQRRRASLLIGELARYFRGVLWQTAGIEAPCPDPDDRKATAALARRLEPEDVFVAADRCIEADYHLARRLYLPLIVSSLVHDLGKVINSRCGPSVSH
jgi:DNA polymerase III subunit delta'